MTELLALTTNPVDWVLAVVLGIPCLIAAMAYIAVWAEERAGCPCQKCHDEPGWSER